MLFYRHLVCRSHWRQTSFSLYVLTLSTSCSSPYCTLLLDSVLLTLLLGALSLSENSIFGSSINAKPAITVRMASVTQWGSAKLCLRTLEGFSCTHFVKCVQATPHDHCWHRDLVVLFLLLLQQSSNMARTSVVAPFRML